MGTPHSLRDSALFAAMLLLPLNAGAQDTDAGQQPPRPAIQIVASKMPGEAVRLSLTALHGAQMNTTHVVLNGMDVSSSFAPHPCGTSTCAETTFYPGAEMHHGKNVVRVTGEGADGRLVTARLRFEAAGASQVDRRRCTKPWAEQRCREFHG